MFFNPFALSAALRMQDKRHSRLTELDMRMHDFLVTKKGRASASVLKGVASARDHVRREIARGAPSIRTE